MKQILTILGLVPILVFGQVNERTQKQWYRDNNFRQTTPSTPFYPRSDSYERQQKQYYNSYSFRPQPIRPIPVRPAPIFRYHTPMYGWDYWYPYSWYDPYGFRSYGRVYYYRDGSRDTVETKFPKVNIGVQTSGDQAGAWFTIGDNIYLIGEFQTSLSQDRSVYYNSLTPSIVNPWNDKRLKDISKGMMTYIGFGKRLRTLGIHGLIGFGREEKRYQYFDETFTLSNTGKYSFLQYRNPIISTKIGVFKEYKTMVFKLGYDFNRYRPDVGIGIGF